MLVLVSLILTGCSVRLLVLTCVLVHRLALRLVVLFVLFGFCWDVCLLLYFHVLVFVRLIVMLRFCVLTDKLDLVLRVWFVVLCCSVLFAFQALLLVWFCSFVDCFVVLVCFMLFALFA